MPDVASLVTVSVPSFSDLAARLDRDEAAIVFYESQSQWIVFVLEGTQVRSYAIDAQTLSLRLKSFLTRIRALPPQPSLDVSEALYRLLLEQPLRDVRARHLLIVPAGALYYLPFAALHDGSHYLVERYTLRVLPSLSVLALPRRQAAGRGGLVIGNPNREDPARALPMSEDEARAIARAADGSTLLLGSQATLAAVEREAKGHQFLHFAGHALFDATNPLASRLELAASPRGPEFLTAAAIYGLRFDETLAVLSSCETGLGEVKAGDDVIGLVRGFLFAGPSTVIATLWTIQDEATGELMRAFYTSYLAGGSPAEAMRAAQTKFIAEGKPPTFWAAFFVTSIL
jgi:CHAT domain-containing protein